jgi:hypothetical protein
MDRGCRGLYRLLLLREYKAQSEEPIPENVARFLEELQRVAA